MTGQSNRCSHQQQTFFEIITRRVNNHVIASTEKEEKKEEWWSVFVEPGYACWTCKKSVNIRLGRSYILCPMCELSDHVKCVHRTCLTPDEKYIYKKLSSSGFMVSCPEHNRIHSAKIHIKNITSSLKTIELENRCSSAWHIQDLNALCQLPVSSVEVVAAGAIKANVHFTRHRQLRW